MEFCFRVCVGPEVHRCYVTPTCVLCVLTAGSLWSPGAVEVKLVVCYCMLSTFLWIVSSFCTGWNAADDSAQKYSSSCEPCMHYSIHRSDVNKLKNGNCESERLLCARAMHWHGAGEGGDGLLCNLPCHTLSILGWRWGDSQCWCFRVAGITPQDIKSHAFPCPRLAAMET